MIRYIKFISCPTFVVAVLVVFSVGASPQSAKKTHKIAKATPVTEALGLFKYKTSKLGKPKLEKDGLYFGNFKINNTFNIVDELMSEKQCAATIFMKEGVLFKRVSSNIRLDGASRAVGSFLKMESKPYQVLSKGDSYFSVVEVEGKLYDAGYQPIKDDEGKVVGAYFVGFLKETLSPTPVEQTEGRNVGAKAK